MKKLKYILLFILIFLVSIIKVDAEGVSIKSIDLIDQIGSATEINEPKVNGLNIDFDLAFKDVGDSIKYEVVLSNPTNKEYEINTEKQFSTSNFISYTYELKDKTNRVKANSEVILYITIKYENGVPLSSLVDGKYIENNAMGINLLNEDNPDTFSNILFLIIMISLLIIATLVFKYTKNKDFYIVVMSLLIIPISVFAIEKLSITIGTKILIAEGHTVTFSGYELVKASDIGYDEYCDPVSRVYIDIEEANLCYRSRTDNNTYFEGEHINIDDMYLLEFDEDECTLDDHNHRIICPSDSLKNKKIETFNFYCDSGLSYCSRNYIESFRFNSVIDLEWNEDSHDGYITFSSPNSFIMPNYDVIFTYEYDGFIPVYPPI